MWQHIRASLVALGLFTVITGVFYPLVVTGIAQGLLAHQANGSMISKEGQFAGSELIGMPFDAPQYFWSRPSATTPAPYNAASSAGSNLGPANPALTDAVKQRIAALKAADPGNPDPVPVDLVTTSASGLDPHLSPAAADYQVRRVARARKIPEEQVRQLVAQCTEHRFIGILGEIRVNVVKLNLTLDTNTR